MTVHQCNDTGIKAYHDAFMAGLISCRGSSTFVLRVRRIGYFPVIAVTRFCVLCVSIIRSRPYRISLFHTIMLSEFYIISILLLCAMYG